MHFHLVSLKGIVLREFGGDTSVSTAHTNRKLQEFVCVKNGAIARDFEILCSWYRIHFHDRRPVRQRNTISRGYPLGVSEYVWRKLGLVCLTAVRPVRKFFRGCSIRQNPRPVPGAGSGQFWLPGAATVNGVEKLIHVDKRRGEGRAQPIRCCAHATLE